MSRFIVAGAAATLIAFSANAQTVEYTSSVASGPKSAGTIGTHLFIDKVEQASNGRVKFKKFVGGALLTFNATLAGVRDGVADVGWMLPQYHPAEFPNGKLIGDLAMVGTDGYAMAFTVTEFVLLNCADCLAEHYNQKQVFTGTGSTPPYRLIMVPKVVDAADMKGVKIRSGGPVWNRWAAHFGAVPVVVPSDDTYQALTSGQIDGTIHPISNFKSYNYWDKARNLNLLPMGTFHSMSLLSWNQTTWRKMSSADRRMMLDNAPFAHLRTVTHYETQENEALEEGPKFRLAVTEPAPAFAAAHAEWVKNDLKNVISSNPNVREGDKKVARFIEIYDKWNKAVAPLRKDEAALIALMQKEIMSKVDAASHGVAGM
jgi:TRAP-type C4-dicarboxylate transport system substrate-binding protein